MTKRRSRISLGLGVLALVASVVAFSADVETRPPAASKQSPVRRTIVHPGTSSTLLPDGRWLVVGGQVSGRSSGRVAVWNPVTSQTKRVAGRLYVRRAWHTATVLPDGTVLIFGGVDAHGTIVDVGELYDPRTEALAPISVAGLVPRAYHTTTLLTDGRVLVAGGIGTGGEPLATLELWDPVAQHSEALGATLAAPRAGHTARLLADGRVYLEGGQGDPSPTLGEIVDPDTGGVTPVDVAPADDSGPARIVASQPSDGSAEVDSDGVRIALRFSEPALMEAVHDETVVLSGPAGPLPAQTVPAEGGMLLFVSPTEPLGPGVSYVVTVDGVSTGDESIVGAVRFTTRAKGETSRPGWTEGPGAEGAVPAPPAGDAERPDSPWWPTRDWKTHRGRSRWQELPPLLASPGETAIAGQVLRLDGKPLRGVTVAVEERSVQTDETGRFLLHGIAAGHVELVLDGRTASRGKETYGLFEYGMDVRAGETNVLGFTSWMPALDTMYEVEIASPTAEEVIITNPKIPGLELHLPAGTTIRDRDGSIVTRVGITPIPVDRPPFPLPAKVEVPIYFTVQPGGAYVEASWWQGARLIYPNYTDQPAHSGAKFWHYDPEERGWYVYGVGRVTLDRRQVMPEPSTVLYEFTGAMINSDNVPPDEDPKDCEEGGDPVNLGTGLFVLEDRDLYLPDLLPLDLTRTYRSNDPYNRPFGIGTNHPYSIYLWSANQYQEADLILPDGSRVHYVRTSPGTGFTDAVFDHPGPTGTCPSCQGRGSPFYGSRIAWNGLGWDLTRKDGTVYQFGDEAPLHTGLSRSLLNAGERRLG